MRYNDLCKVAISALGLGCMRFPTVPDDPNRFDRAEAQKVIDAAIEKGINYFDSAYSYQNGDSERLMGEALQKYPRDSYYIGTKFSLSATEDIEAAFEEQLRRLQTDYVDFYMLHWLHEGSLEAYTDPKRDYIGYIRRQKEAGRIHRIGFSSHAAPETLERFLEYFDGYDMAVIQLNYVDWTLLEGKKQYDILTAHHIPIWVMEPLKGGRLADLGEEANAILKQAAPERSIASWGMRWLLDLPNVNTIMSGMGSVEQVNDNAAAVSESAPLTQGERDALKKAAAVFVERLGVPCSACRYCCKTCPAKLDIPLIIRGYNEAVIGGQGSWKIGSLGLESDTDAKLCLQCGACASHCPQHIAIPEIMRKLALGL